MNIELLTKFAGFLTEKVTDMNRPIIADFLEKFLVVEIKKMEDGETTESEMTTPAKDVAPEPIRVVKEEPRSTKPARVGNGHKIEKKRDLTDEEKGLIRDFFTGRNGQIENDACVEFKKNLDPDIAIFQVAGFVTYLHHLIAMGKWTVADMTAYISFLKSHRALWSTYDSPKYRALRRRLGIVDESSRPAEPEESSLHTGSIDKDLVTPSFAVGYKRSKTLCV